MSTDFSELKFKYKIWLETENGEGVLGEGKYRLLKKIEETGSLKLAIEQLGLSYRKTWDNLRRIEEILGFDLIDRQRGGAAGGSSALTPQGKRFIEVFDKFLKQHDPVIQGFLKDLKNDLQKTD
ncbi:MAG: LysR family transcriptional regulator [Bacteroidales bacterium]|nr:LysR family transcriptional regulator [Bacteroidales bacterium]HOY38459.1 LysR family transcriptional regulator [Bacteroidales bacterium]HQP04153.1 LysR family transcriptional regulator [Bacteroidales bacterium]